MWFGGGDVWGNTRHKSAKGREGGEGRKKEEGGGGSLILVGVFWGIGSSK